MALDERHRHELFLGCEEVFGPERAETLMALLPPVGWADVATKQDLVQLEVRMDARFDTLEARFDSRFEVIDSRFEVIDSRFEAIDSRFETVDARFETLEARFIGELHRTLNAQTKVLFFGIITVLTSIAAIAVALAR